METLRKLLSRLYDEVKFDWLIGIIVQTCCFEKETGAAPKGCAGRA